MKVTSAEFVKGIRGTNEIAVNGIPQVAFVGRSNVGKSSLIANITHDKSLVKVSNTPGKTREINFFLINKKTYLVDLPGYGYARVNPTEKEKLQKLILWYLTDKTIRPKKVAVVLDARVGVTTFDTQMVQILTEQKHPFCIVANKIDKLSKKELQEVLINIRAKVGDVEIFPTSAIEHKGAEDLAAALFA